MENITILFDTCIALLSIWVLFKLIGYGGNIGKSLSQIGYGIVIIGISQAVETMGLMFIDKNVFDIHIIHRSILVIGFSLVAWGFKNLMNKSQPIQTNQ
jgi:membrane-bound acyltransferase YfiQ involved in biofilm formation